MFIRQQIYIVVLGTVSLHVFACIFHGNSPSFLAALQPLSTYLYCFSHSFMTC